MHEYPLIFFFVIFAIALFFVDKPIFFVALILFLISLYGDKVFRLFLKRYEWEHYNKVFILPFGNNAYAVGNSILIGKRLLSEEKDILHAILYHELGHIHYRDFLTTFLFLVFLKFSTRFVSGKEYFLFAVLYSLLFFWVYWHMEVRCDMYAKAHGHAIEKALEKYNLRWRLNFLRKETKGDWQEKAIYLAFIFISGLYLGWLFRKGF